MPLPSPLLDGTRRDYSISHLVEMSPIETTSDNERRLLRLVLPPWQRGECWSVEQKTRFIEGIFLGLGTGYYVVNGADYADGGRPLPMSGWLLDGQQRISAIRDFMDDRFPVFQDVFYSGLDRPTRLRRFLRESFPCFELEYTGNEAVLKDLYNRLNFGGTPHTENDRAQPKDDVWANLTLKDFGGYEDDESASSFPFSGHRRR